MLLTKDNLVRYIREKKYVTPTDIAEKFDTTTMISSAALSELSKEGIIKITYLKLSSSPYYYDPKQKESLIELGEKHFKGIEKGLFEKIKENQIIADQSLSIAERVSIEKLKDFAIPLEIIKNEKKLLFWVWYLRDLNETKKQILNYLENKEKKNNNSDIKKDSKEEIRTEEKKQFESPITNSNLPRKSKIEKTNKENKKTSNEIKIEKDQEKEFIERYLDENYLIIEEIDKTEKGTLYNTYIKINSIKIYIDCMYFLKKPSDGELLKFYASSLRPKIVFIKNSPKKFFKLAEELENLTIVNI